MYLPATTSAIGRGRGGVQIIAQRWRILAILTFTRSVMAFQFQSVGALSPLIVSETGIGLADVGLLIGLYFAPGVLVAIPGGTLAALFGDKRIVTLGLLLMLTGGLMIYMAPDWAWMVAGRVIAGAGGVIINIVLTKMVVDWFAEREIATAMGIFINSWPVGIALALVVLPPFADASGLAVTWLAVTVLTGVALVTFVAGYTPPEALRGKSGQLRFTALPVWPLFLAAMVWSLYNVALALVFSFAPVVLLDLGWELAVASTATSGFMLFFALGIPVGGVVADLSGRQGAVIACSLVAFAILLPLVLVLPLASALATFLVLGFIFGLAGGPIVAMPAKILQPVDVAFGMGVYYAIYYGVMMAGPPLFGRLAEAFGTSSVVFLTGAAIMAPNLLALLLFRRASSGKTGEC